MLYDSDAQLYILTEGELAYLDQCLRQRVRTQKTLMGILALGVFSFGQVLTSLLIAISSIWFVLNILLVPACILGYRLQLKHSRNQNEDFAATLKHLREGATPARAARNVN